MSGVRYIGDLERIECKPGDVFVLRTDRALTYQEAENFRLQWKHVVGRAKLLILGPGDKLGVFGQAALQEAGGTEGSTPA